MRRSVDIAVAVFAVLVLLRPFDCFAGAFTRKAAACCTKGKCLPSKDADECCKGTVPAGTQLSAPKASDDSAPIVALALPDIPVSTAPSLIAFDSDEVLAPPGSPPGKYLNLPLLI
jgi:hypothetical protein